MQIVNMDVERFGGKSRCYLGDFSSGLNAICGPSGSGKTTLVSWLRDVTSENGWNGLHDVPVVGSVEIQQITASSAKTNGHAHSSNTGRISTDRKGRVHYAPHGAVAGREFSRSSLVSESQRRVFNRLMTATGAMDTEGALQQLVRDFDLEAQETTHNQLRLRLLERQSVLNERLEKLRAQSADHQTLLASRDELERELTETRDAQARYRYTGHAVDHRRLVDRAGTIDVDLKNSLLELEQIDREIADLQAEMKMCEVGQASVVIDGSFRSQLQQLEERLQRWRQTLRDLRAHRERIEHDLTDSRLDQQIGDQLSSSKHADPRAAMRSLEAQILNTKRQLDQLVESVGKADNQSESSYRVNHDRYGRTHIAYDSSLSRVPENPVLPETLRAMQADLYEVCQQLARHEATTAAETYRQQSQQLQRCENELLRSVEKLIEERAQLLRKIADENHLSVEQLNLAFGEWCQCHDHAHLHDWLLKDEQQHEQAAIKTGDRTALIEKLELMQERRKQLTVHIEDCKRQLRETDYVRRDIRTTLVQPAGRPEHEIIRDLDNVSVQIRGLEERGQILRELEEVRSQLASTHATVVNRFDELVDQHIAGLMGADYRNGMVYTQNGFYDPAERYSSDSSLRIESRQEVPNAMRRLAMRLAIAELMASRGEPVSLVIDQPLDGLSADIQRTAISYLSVVAGRGQQILVMTSDEGVASLVRSQGGFVDYIHAVEEPVAEPVAEDVNQTLSAWANDWEADKWERPHVAEPEETSPYYLLERSELSEYPSISDDVIDDLREIRIVFVGDFLDVDAQWLADELDLQEVSAGTVQKWQTEVQLLTQVPNIRPFDARVLVGAGVRSANELSQKHPSQLLERVEQFLATDRGRSILRSGSSYELSRITSWIASAKGGANQRSSRSSDRNRRSSRTRSQSAWSSRGFAHDNEGYDREARGYSSRSRSVRSSRSSSTSRRRDSERDRNESRERTGRARSAGSGSSRSTYQIVHREQQSSSERSSNGARSSSKGPSSKGRSSSRTSRSTSRSSMSTASASTNKELKFYLELSSPVVDAPSIGPRMANRLEKLNILTVDQLLAADAEMVADKLDLRRVTSETIVAWQNQATLVCRIPFLRGHDAQLLVACDLISPEELAGMNPQVVLTQVLEVAHSSEGARILRGGKEPDLEEVQDWIQWASSHRSLNAA